MSKIMQNLVVLVEPSNYAEETPLKAGNMILNRFCIDEDAAFELPGVHYLKEPPTGFGRTKLNEKRKAKGKEYLVVLSKVAELYFHQQLIIIPQRTF